MFAFIPLALLAFGVPPPATAAVEGGCSGIQIYACLFLVDGDKISSDRLAETEDQLNKRCDESLPIMKCLNDYAVNCPGGDFEKLKSFFIDEYAARSKLCDKNQSFRKRYLEHAKCLNKHRAQIENKCGKLFHFSDALTEDLCISYAETFQCTHKQVRATCGDGAVEVGKEVLTPQTSLLDHLCSNIQSADWRYLAQIRKRYAFLP